MVFHTPSPNCFTRELPTTTSSQWIDFSTHSGASENEETVALSSTTVYLLSLWGQSGWLTNSFVKPGKGM